MVTRSHSGTRTEFVGISFDSSEAPFNQIKARQDARLLIDKLIADKRVQSEIGVSVSRRKTISANADGSVWYEADPINVFHGLIRSTIKPPHLNFTLGRDYLAFGLTFPNASFAKTLQLGIQKLDAADRVKSELEALLDRFVALDKFGIAYTPYCYLEQKHFLSQKARPRQDAELRFDIRVLTGYKNVGHRLKIKGNPVWVDLFRSAILDRTPGCHVQAGFGINIPFVSRNKEFFGQADEIINALIVTWGALIPFARALAMR